ncbi:hypothetical protein E5676_scaffold863G00540 [Cucumis melo var. makuwa]|uniref:Uncharacterized protein n=1 Tax=Cucumis melo var. makuwa TaxID=1194695 RepID=A0A5D3BXX4_CUCMM|nr:hypothetical protein E5676_scaffold863G00540 [Cucumis melo var. makuwa]
MKGCAPGDTPVAKGSNLHASRYCIIVRELGGYLSNPGMDHWKAAKRVERRKIKKAWLKVKKVKLKSTNYWLSPQARHLELGERSKEEIDNLQIGDLSIWTRVRRVVFRGFSVLSWMAKRLKTRSLEVRKALGGVICMSRLNFGKQHMPRIFAFHKLSLFTKLGLLIKFEKRKDEFELEEGRKVISRRDMSSLHFKETTKCISLSFWLNLRVIRRDGHEFWVEKVSVVCWAQKVQNSTWLGGKAHVIAM